MCVKTEHYTLTTRFQEDMFGEEAAIWLQMAPKTLRNWRSAGIGPAAPKLQGRVPVSSFVAYRSWLSDPIK